MSDYRVEHLINETYQVIESQTEDIGEDGNPAEVYSDVIHQGTLADCEAFIRLREGGYM